MLVAWYSRMESDGPEVDAPPTINYVVIVVDASSESPASSKSRPTDARDEAAGLVEQALSAIKNSEMKTTVYSCSRCCRIFTERDAQEKHERHECPLQAKHNLRNTRRKFRRPGRTNADEVGDAKSPSKAPVVPEQSLSAIRPRSYLCKRCLSTWDSVLELHWHSIEKHPTRPAELLGVPHNTQMRCAAVTNGGDEGDFLFTCQRCLRCYLNAVDLDRHLGKHKTERPYTCQICEEELNMNCFRSRHYRKCYGKLAPARFVCAYCDATFPIKRALINHLRDHSREKQTLICGHCDCGFPQRSAVRQHLQQRHFVQKDVEACFANGMHVAAIETDDNGTTSENDDANSEFLPPIPDKIQALLTSDIRMEKVAILSAVEGNFIDAKDGAADASLNDKLKTVFAFFLERDDAGWPKRVQLEAAAKALDDDTLACDAPVKDLIKKFALPKALEQIDWDGCSADDILEHLKTTLS